MIERINHRDPILAWQIYQLQQTAYAVERDLIEYPDFPPLRVTAADIQQETEQFLGYWHGDHLVGVISFHATAIRVDIGRLIVHPQAFRQGIASALLTAVEQYRAPEAALTVSTAAKNIPAVSLYQKHGYRIVERTRLPDGLELVRFRKDDESS